MVPGNRGPAAGRRNGCVNHWGTGRHPRRAALPVEQYATWLLDEVALWPDPGCDSWRCKWAFAQNEVPRISNLHAVLPAEDRLVAHYFSIQEDDFFRLFPRL